MKVIDTMNDRSATITVKLGQATLVCNKGSATISFSKIDKSVFGDWRTLLAAVADLTDLASPQKCELTFVIPGSDLAPIEAAAADEIRQISRADSAACVDSDDGVSTAIVRPSVESISAGWQLLPSLLTRKTVTLAISSGKVQIGNISEGIPLHDRLTISDLESLVNAIASLKRQLHLPNGATVVIAPESKSSLCDLEVRALSEALEACLLKPLWKWRDEAPTERLSLAVMVFNTSFAVIFFLTLFRVIPLPPAYVITSWVVCAIGVFVGLEYLKKRNRLKRLTRLFSDSK